MEGDSEQESYDEETFVVPIISKPSFQRASSMRQPTMSILKQPTLSFIEPAQPLATNEEGGAEVNCDELIKELVGETPIKAVDQPEILAKESKGSKDSKLEHDPECPMYEDPSKPPTAESSNYNFPCPPGARKCCTCMVCPLDLIDQEKEKEKEKEKEIEEEKEKEMEKEKEKEKDKEKEKKKKKDKKTDKEKKEDKKKEKEKKKKEKKKGMDDDEEDASWRRDDTSSSDDYSDMVWDGEGWGIRHHKHRHRYDSSEDDITEKGGLQDYYDLSDRSSHEGRFAEDYMRFFIEPIEVCYKSLSSVSSSYVSCEDTGLQRTIVIVKPQAVQFKEAIYRVIFEAGFQILGLRVLHLTPEQVSEIYSKYYGSPSFVHLVVSVSEAPVLAICISAMNVIKRWLTIIGPDGSLRSDWFYPLSMRKLFGLQDTHADWIHGSENLRESNKENRYFYPKAIIEPLIQELDKVTDYCALTMNKTIVEACAEVVKKRPADPIIFFADYLLLHNPFQPRFPKNIAMTPT